MPPATVSSPASATLCPRWLARSVTGFTALLLAACAAVGPDYLAPSPDDLTVPADWQAALPHGGSTAGLEDWWSRLGDPLLIELQAQALKSNPSMQKAAAQIGAARAALASAEAAEVPSLTLAGSGSRAKAMGATGATSVTNSASLALDASWELDLFGSVRRNVESGQATAQARLADWNDTRVSLAAEVATDYINYRACEATLKLARADAASREATARITEGSFRAGANASSDVALANASAASGRASVLSQQADCQIDVKGLVPLVGLPEARLQQLLDQGAAQPLQPALFEVQRLPLALLSQRPDLVAKERALAAASASVGVAEAGRYPRLSLAGSIGRSGADLGGAARYSTPWSFGPSLSLPVFDGGAARANVRSAEANYEVALAAYRDAVGTAVKEVEQGLVRLGSAEAREADLRRSAEGYRRVATATETAWRAGSESLLTLEQTRRDAISAEQALLAVQRDRLLYGVALYKAVGGGWDTSLPDPQATTATLTR